MKVNEKLLLTFFAATIFNVATTSAQLFKDVSIGINGGAYVYQGDLSPSGAGSLKTVKAGFNFYVQKPLSEYLSVRLNLGLAKLKGDESKYSSPAFMQKRNFMFSTPLTELSGLLLWNIKGSNYENNGTAPYVFTGITLAFMHTAIDYSRVDTTTANYKDATIFSKIARDVDHGTPRTIAVIPLGVGAEFPLSEKLFLTTEAAYRFSFTDYIDGFSIAADPAKNDHYYSATIGIRYRFNNNNGSSKNNKGLGCPANIGGF